MKQLTVRPGTLIETTTVGRFVCKRYVGTFIIPNLQHKANTGGWYATAQGTGIKLQGHGNSPESAIADLQRRAIELRDEVTRVYSI